MLLPPSTLLRHGSTYVATVFNVAKAWKHSNVITTFSTSHLMHVMKSRFKGTTYLHRPCAVSVGFLSPSPFLLCKHSLSSCRTRRCQRLYGHNHENQIFVSEFKDITSIGHPIRQECVRLFTAIFLLL
ncbi:hypothetical protein GQ457_08G017380 [Hibiscus cannabinus]